MTWALGLSSSPGHDGRGIDPHAFALVGARMRLP